MSEATEKQISYATSLGIQNPSQYTKEALKGLISAKTGKTSQPQQQAQLQPSNAVVGATGGIAEINHNFQSEYEFGPAGNRHKIKYFKIDELKSKFEALKTAGFIENLGAETEKI